jgi:hypothetical protein
MIKQKAGRPAGQLANEYLFSVIFQSSSSSSPVVKDGLSGWERLNGEGDRREVRFYQHRKAAEDEGRRRGGFEERSTSPHRP